jgi:flagellar biosynthesis/type III secretory pathway protein FliH
MSYDDHDTETDLLLASQYDNYRTPSAIREGKARTEGYNAGYAQAVADMKAERLAEAEQMLRRVQTPRTPAEQQLTSVAYAVDKILGTEAK